jgi:hypothetical protein
MAENLGVTRDDGLLNAQFPGLVILIACWLDLNVKFKGSISEK